MARVPGRQTRERGRGFRDRGQTPTRNYLDKAAAPALESMPVRRDMQSILAIALRDSPKRIRKRVSMLKKHLALTLAMLFLAVAAAAAQKVERTIKTTYLNPWQAMITCKSGHTPVVKEVSGSLLVSCEAREQ